VRREPDVHEADQIRHSRAHARAHAGANTRAHARAHAGANTRAHVDIAGLVARDGLHDGMWAN
jgi:hypothetical protein